jgi:hypothetical protein
MVSTAGRRREERRSSNVKVEVKGRLKRRQRVLGKLDKEERPKPTS